jgi:serine/threonine protein kinase
VPAFSPHRFGQYTLTARLGRGGMADVYRARREGAAGFERVVVVKKILGGHHEDPAFVEMFINEAKLSARLTHPNIAQVHELGEEDGEFFIVMEYVKGKDLLRLLRHLAQSRPQQPAIPPLVAAYIARETCRGLAHAHEHTDENGAVKPIVHRDISPQNIMLSYDGQVKLVDFGIAKALDNMKEETRTGALKGKFAYMAPEQIGGHSPGAQSDIFSTGVVLHEMLTGRRLFKGGSDYETLEKVQNLRVPPPSSLNRVVSPELDAIALQALDRAKGQRYARAAHMARDLDVYLQAHRFAVEDMAEYMKEVFPVEAREEAGEGPITDTMPAARPQEPTSASSPKAIAGTPSALRARRVEADARAAAGRRRVLLSAGGAALLVMAGAAVIYPLATRAPSSTSSPGEARTTPSAPTVAVAPPMPPASRELRVSSEPPGAQVYQGPKLIGTAPVTLRLEPSGSAAVTLVRPGYEDLTYTVQASDGPTLTLRLVRERPSSPPPPSPAPAPSPRKTVVATPGKASSSGRDKPAHKLRVDAVDDGDRAPHVPKVQAIDD